MGHQVSCECLTDTFKNVTTQISRLTSEQLPPSEVDKLKKDTEFRKKVIMGLTSQIVILRLSDDTGTLSWRCPETSVGATWSAISGSSTEEFGEISLVENIATVRTVGTHGFSLVDFSKKIVLEVESEDAEIRDLWVKVLNDLLQSWVSNPASKPKSTISAAGTSNKAAYFAMREKQIQENKRIADEKRKKYTAGGMKYTAIAMMNREG